MNGQVNGGSMIRTVVAIVQQSMGAAAFVTLIYGFNLYREDTIQQHNQLIQSHQNLADAFLALKSETARDIAAWDALVDVIEAGNDLRQLQIDLMKKLLDRADLAITELCIIDSEE
jgi:hypothetical protein